MTTLVTGASGGLGRILCRNLRDAGDDVVGVARRGSARDGVLECDVTGLQAVRDLISRVRPKLVYHLAGSFSNHYETDYAVNTEAARHLLEACAAVVPSARIVLVGSAAEYGLLRPDENPVKEDRVLRPVSIYGLTKSYQTLLGVCFAHARGADVVVARLFNLMAAGLSERLFIGRVERLIAEYAEGQIDRIEVGNLDSQRDYVEGSEAAAQLRAIAARGARGEIYHVASGTAVQIRQVLHRMLDAAGIPREAVVEATAAGGRAGYDVPVIRADMRRTRALMEAT